MEPVRVTETCWMTYDVKKIKIKVLWACKKLLIYKMKLEN